MKKTSLLLLTVIMIGLLFGAAYLRANPEASHNSVSIIREESEPVSETEVAVAPELATVLIETPVPSELHICDRSPEKNFSSMLCYTAKPDDTLWGIAERYLGDGSRWGELHDGAPLSGEYQWNPETRESTYVGYSRLEDPATQLWPGMEVGMHTSSMLPLDLVAEADKYFIETSKLSVYNDDLLIVVNTRGSNQKLVYLNGELFSDRTYRDISHMNFSEDGTRITYIAKDTWNKCELIVDGVAEHAFICGYDIQDPLFSPNGQEFVFRTNLHNPGVWTGPDAFHVVSSLGDGSDYDYVDSLTWVDDESFVYRAQANNEWRVVVNHKDVAVYDFLENLKVENGIVTFSARHADGSWTQETLDVSGE